VAGPFLYYTEVLIRLMPERDYAVRLEALAEALPLEVVATDAEGRVVVWNEALARVAGPGATRWAAPGRRAAVPARGPERGLAALLSDVLAGRPGRTLPRHPLGSRVVRATVAPMRGAGRGARRRALLRGHHARRAEEERRRLQARSDAVTALGAGIAHEVRNPLNSLLLNLQLLRERLADPGAPRDDLVRKTDATIAEAARMETLVQNLLEVSRGDPRHRGRTGRRRRARRRGPPPRGRPGPDVQVRVRSGLPPRAPLERTRIERAVQNIVRNAVEAAPRRPRVDHDPRRSHSTVVVVDDDGRASAPRPGAGLRALLDEQAGRHGTRAPARQARHREPRRRDRGAGTAGRRAGSCCTCPSGRAGHADRGGSTTWRGS